MTLNRDFALKLLLAVALLGFGTWIYWNTEWADVEESTPAHGEAERDNFYAFKQVLAKLGVKVVTPPNFERLPPAGATLVLSSQHWTMFPGRDQRLRDWVEGGGHLVVDDLMLVDGKALSWIPVRHLSRAGAASAASAAEAPPPKRAPLLGPPGPSRSNCSELAEPDDLPGAFGAPRKYRICSLGVRPLKASVPVLWSLDSAKGSEFVRVPVGRGMVTARSDYGLFGNLEILRADHALAAVALLHLKPGAEVWLVNNETRSPLLEVIWSSGAPAVLLGAVALALALWRGAVRFGPRAPAAALARRSVAEQIRGTAHFIWQRNGGALLRAQLRALDEAARSRIRQHDRLDRRARAEAIAKITALDADALSRAMDPAIPRRRGELPPTLALLESARRRLLSR